MFIPWRKSMINRIFVKIMIVSVLFMACPSAEKAYKDQLAEMGIEFNETNFAKSIIRGETKVVQLFLKAGMPPQTKSNGITPLLEAARRGHSEIALALINAGADVNVQDVFGVSATMFAGICGSTELLERLIDCGANVNVKDVDGRTALVEALTTENDLPVSVIKSLIEAGADPNIRTRGGVTPLMLAATGDPEILRILIAAGADVNSRDDNGATALMRAVHDIENASILKAAGAQE
jgi:ankyrin repeat protein